MKNFYFITLLSGAVQICFSSRPPPTPTWFSVMMRIIGFPFWNILNANIFFPHILLPSYPSLSGVSSPVHQLKVEDSGIQGFLAFCSLYSCTSFLVIFLAEIILFLPSGVEYNTIEIGEPHV